MCAHAYMAHRVCEVYMVRKVQKVRKVRKVCQVYQVYEVCKLKENKGATDISLGLRAVFV